MALKKKLLIYDSRKVCVKSKTSETGRVNSYANTNQHMLREKTRLHTQTNICFKVTFAHTDICFKVTFEEGKCNAYLNTKTDLVTGLWIFLTQIFEVTLLI